MKVNFSRIFFYLWPQIKKHWVSFFLVFSTYGIAIVISAIIEPYLYKEIIDALSSGDNREVIFKTVINLGFLVALVVVLHNILYRIGDYSITYFESNVVKKLHDFSFERLLQHSYHFFSNNFSGSIIAKTKRLTRSFEQLMDILSYQIWFSLITLIGIFIVLLIEIPILAYIFFAWSAVYMLITILFIRKKVGYDKIEAEADSKVTGHLSDSILNIFNIKIFSSEKREQENYGLVTEEEEQKRRKAWNFGNFQMVVQGILMAILHVSSLFVSLYLWRDGSLSIGVVVLIQTYMITLFRSLRHLGQSLTKAMKALIEMKEVVDIFDTPIDILDPVSPESLGIKDGNIKFNNITFSYENGSNVFEDFSLEIKAGEKIGLVGHSGAGKTTITKLLLRFTDVDKGNITIDGQDIKNLTQNNLRSIISYVPQESILFHRSIKENIAYSKPNATIKEVEEVSKKAHAHEFILKMQSGYDTLVGERGVKLSGGERQRVAIARAMLKNSPILMLDEATSSLDSISEGYIQEAFEKLMEGKTTIVIAHRLSTIQKMDRIVVFNDGVVEEMGTHKELLEKNGQYAELWNHQSGGFIE